MSATAVTAGLTSLVDRLLDSAAAEAGERPPERTIEVTRREGPGPDVAVRLASAAWAKGHAGRRALEVLDGDARVGEVRARGSRFTVRFSDEHVTAVGAALEAGALGLGSTLLRGQTWGVEFCDPNANKALHVGHLRNLALGNALAALLAGAGAGVARQSIICDIGRNVCEAMAGYVTAPPGDDPAAAGLKGDHFVGRCYSRYVASVTAPQAPSPIAADAPIERELRAAGDLADRLMRGWVAGDPDVRRVWRRLRRWALDGQQETLARLGIRFDRVLFESDAFASLRALVRRGLDSGAFAHGDDGALVFRTGRQEYPVLPLVRPDGFPTEHLRVMALWYMPGPAARLDACVHVVGHEWVASTDCRELAAARLGERPMFASYLRLPHGMVVVDGDLMKSSSGRAVLVDDCLDRLAGDERARRLGDALGGPEAVARLVALGFFLDGRPPRLPISFSWPALEADDGAAWAWARAWAAAARGSAGSRPDPDGADPSYRFAVLQSQVLPGLLERAATALDPAPIARYLTHLARWHSAARPAPPVQRVVRATLEAALGALGLTAEEERCPQSTTWR